MGGKVGGQVCGCDGDKRIDEKDSMYVLRLYVTGTTPRSQESIRNIRKICEEELQGRYDLEVIDVYQQPTLAKVDQIIAIPTLIRKFPLPSRKLVGDMSDKKKVISGLEIMHEKRSGKNETREIGY